MIDKKWIGYTGPEVRFDIERGRLKFFAQAIGESNPIYLDQGAAQAAGYRDLPVPPTFLLAADLDSNELFSTLAKMGVSLGKILHGEQGYTYHQPVCAGETVTVCSRISDIYDKKGGALEFIVRDSSVTNASGELAAEFRSVIVVRN